MTIDLIGDGGQSCPAEIRSFEHWWDEVQQITCSTAWWSRVSREAARAAWNAALEKAAREFGAMKTMNANVDYAAVCRQLQVPTETQP